MTIFMILRLFFGAMGIETAVHPPPERKPVVYRPGYCAEGHGKVCRNDHRGD